MSAAPHPYSAKIQKLHHDLLIADGLLKAVDQLAAEALGHRDVCDAVYALLTTLKRLSDESTHLASQLADMNWEGYSHG